MGLAKQYLRYVPGPAFGIVASSKSNILFLDFHGTSGRYVAAGAVENVIIWDLRKREKALVLVGDKHEVSFLSSSSNKQGLLRIAVGYSNGSISVFDPKTGDCQLTFNGHKSQITSLSFDEDGARLVSGSQDTNVVIWDMINESGLYRLNGHKGPITKCVFLSKRNFLVTSSKDTFIKLWDLDTQHCFKTLVGHRTEVWDFVLVSDEKRMVTGTADTELRVWDIEYVNEEEETSVAVSEKPAKFKKSEPIPTAEVDELLSDKEEVENWLKCVQIGSFLRQGRHRVVTISLDRTGTILACHGPDSLIEIFKVLSSEERQKKLQKKLKRARKKQRKLEETNESEQTTDIDLTLEDQFQRLCVLKTDNKIRSIDVCMEKGGSVKVVAILQNNLLQAFNISLEDKSPEPQLWSAVSSFGHRTDVRTLCFSNDNTAILTASSDSVKIWNRSTQQCIRTMKCGYSLSSFFVAGDRHCIIGTKAGKLEVFDIASGSMLESVVGHSGAVWSLCLAPDKKGFISGGADKTVKYWQFELVQEEGGSSKRLSIQHVWTLKTSEDVLCVKYSPDQKFIAASLMDNTVKVFFSDTLKFFLSLYGHKLPVLSMDISSDSTLLVTGSADRNVKLWGLDFGDCHKSMFAHDDSIMSVQFVANTHLFFTGGKDKLLKQWDGDNHQHVQTLKGHQGDIWCLAVSPNGAYVVSSSHDKSLRLWERTKEPLVLEDEQEMEREADYYEKSLVHNDSVIPGEEKSSETEMAGKKTIETVKASERIMESIELYKEEMEKIDDYERRKMSSKKELPLPPSHPILQAYGNITPLQYVLDVIKKVRSSELEPSLLVLPFEYVVELLKLLNNFVKKEWEIELSSRCIFFLLRIHHGQITSNQVLLPVVDELRQNITEKLQQLRDRMGFNLAGMEYLQRQVEENSEVQFFTDATERFKDKQRKRKKREKHEQAVLVLNS